MPRTFSRWGTLPRRGGWPLAIVDGTALARGRLDASRWPPRTESVDQAVTAEDVNILADTYANLNPAAIQRDIQALTAALLT